MALERTAQDEVVERLREYISAMQRPRIGDSTWIASARQTGADLVSALDRAGVLLKETHESGHHRLVALGDQLRAFIDELAERPTIRSLDARRRALARSYEELRLELGASLHEAGGEAWEGLDELKPTNYARNAFHVTMGITGVTMYHLLLTRSQALMVLWTIFGVFGTLEVTRRFSRRWNDFLVDKVFGAISRPSERFRVNSATLYLAALILITTFFPQRAVEAALLILAIADPVASIAGRRWGARKLFRDKSFAGSGAFFLAAAMSTATLLLLTEGSFDAGRIAAVAAALAAAGTITELLSSRIDDNFSIPVVCAGVGALLL